MSSNVPVYADQGGGAAGRATADGIMKNTGQKASRKTESGLCARWLEYRGQRGALIVDGIFTSRFLRRVEYGFRQGLAVGIACIWVLVPQFAAPLSR
jgi:hypothetical protein